MSNYKPDLSNMIPLVLLVPTTTTVSGVTKKSFPTVAAALQNENNLFFGTFKSYGGTETDTNGVHSIIDTANIETWYRPDIKSDCRIARANDGAIFEIINEPEDINQRHQFLKFKIKRVKGGA
ncbi:MAG: head-tail adaptor protein [Clostridia bacterium]|nr:head-tail adaptor protein [Clostridia bacterium]